MAEIGKKYIKKKRKKEENKIIKNVINLIILIACFLPCRHVGPVNPSGQTHRLLTQVPLLLHGGLQVTPNQNRNPGSKKITKYNHKPFHLHQ